MCYNHLLDFFDGIFFQSAHGECHHGCAGQTGGFDGCLLSDNRLCSRSARVPLPHGLVPVPGRAHVHCKGKMLLCCSARAAFAAKYRQTPPTN